MTSADRSPRTPALVVLAAGLGTRYGGLKQLDPVGPGGTTLMDYALADARRAGYGGAVVVVRREIAAAVGDHLGRTVDGRMPVELALQEVDDLPGGRRPPPGRTRPWGTTHAVWVARDALDGPFVVANADDHYGPGAYEALADHLAGAGRGAATGRPERDPESRARSRRAHEAPRSRTPPAWGLAGYRLGDVLSEHGPVNRGLCRVDGRGWLRDVVEGRDLRHTAEGAVEGRTREDGPVRLTGDEPVSTNLWAFTAGAPAFLEDGLARFLDGRGREDPEAECLLPDVIRQGLAEDACRVRVRRVRSAFFGVTHPEDRPGVVRRLSERGPPWGRSDGDGGSRRTARPESGRAEGA